MWGKVLHPHLCSTRHPAAGRSLLGRLCAALRLRLALLRAARRLQQRVHAASHHAAQRLLAFANLDELVREPCSQLQP